VAAVRLLKLAVNQKSLLTEDNKDNQKFSFNHRSLLPSFPSVKRFNHERQHVLNFILLNSYFSIGVSDRADKNEHG